MILIDTLIYLLSVLLTTPRPFTVEEVPEPPVLIPFEIQVSVLDGWPLKQQKLLLFNQPEDVLQLAFVMVQAPLPLFV